MSGEVIAVIDVQKGFFETEDPALPARIREVLRETDIPVFFTRFINEANSQYERLLGYTEMRGGEVALCSAIDDLSGTAPVFDKTAYSMLNSDAVKSHLETSDFDTVYLMGVETDACVLASAHALFDAGYTPVVVEDLCQSGSPHHASAIQILRRDIGDGQVISSESL